MNYIREYWNRMNDDLVVCTRIYQLYSKFNYDLDHQEEWIFDEDRANAPIDFIESFCKHSKGKWAGKPVILELWQKAKVQAVFGFIDKDGNRKCRETLTIVARKNGKSTFESALGLCMLIADGEPGAEVYCAATKRDQSKIVFNEMLNMVSQSKGISKHVKKRKSDLYFGQTYSSAQPLASDSNSLDGLNSHHIIIDELHGIKDRNLYDVLKQSTASREQPLLDVITTAGFNREGIYDNLYDYACGVLDGDIVDERFLAFIYELDEREEWTDPDCWIKANPSLGKIKPYKYLESNVERAKQDPDFMATVLTKDFNVRETVAGSWLTFDAINNEDTFDMEEVRDTYAIGGADLSSTTDLTCATLIILKKETTYVIQKYFIPRDVMERKIAEDKVPYDIWAERGFVHICEGATVRYSDVTAWYVKMRDDYDILPVWVGYDPWNAQYWVEDMENNGFAMEKVRQGAMTMSSPMKQLGGELSENRINYNNNPILKWCLTNTSVKRDENDNIRPIKGKNQRLRIDGTVSLINAWVILSNNKNDFLTLI